MAYVKTTTKILNPFIYMSQLITMIEKLLEFTQVFDGKGGEEGYLDKRKYCVIVKKQKKNRGSR